MDNEYVDHIIEFINYIIRCFIIPKKEVYMLQFGALLVFLNNSDSSFALKLDVNLHIVARSFEIYLSTYNASCYKYYVLTI